MSHRIERKENVLKTFLVKRPAGALAIPTEIMNGELHITYKKQINIIR